jgi:putative membrane protein
MLLFGKDPLVMKRFFISWLVNTTALLVVVHVVSGISIDRWQTTFVASLVLGLLNTFIRPVLILLTLPVNVLTLGIFTLFINGFMFYMASSLVRGFEVMNFGSAFLGAFVFSIIAFLLNLVIGKEK